ncbi:MAG: energy transducer TonB [Opitutales bacterium]
MRRGGTSGVVTISCLIDTKGNVQEPKVEKASNDAFSQPALDAVRKWKFKPAKKGGTAIALRVSIPIQFSISDD